eukprot:811690-Pelagomonas_calceolata.AAC.3
MSGTLVCSVPLRAITCTDRMPHKCCDSVPPRATAKSHELHPVCSCLLGLKPKEERAQSTTKADSSRGNRAAG